MSTRIRELRERLNLNQDALGALVKVTRQTVAAWEKGQRELSMTQLTALSHALQVPVELLLRQEAVSAVQPRVSVLYRADKRSALSDTDEAIMTRKASDYAFIERLTGVLSWLPESRPMQVFDAAQIEQVAQETRDSLGVEDAPLGDALALLERKGLKVIRTRLPEGVFGFSAYSEDWGAIAFVNCQAQNVADQEGLREIPYERQVFTAFHELGHLIFHRREYREPTLPEGRRDPREDIANYFAGAVLVSARALREDLRGYEGRWLPLPLLCDLKLIYGVSVQTLLYRAAALGIITDKQRGQQLGDLKKRFPHNFGEPEDPICPPSKTMPRLESLVFQALVNDKLGESRAAEILGWPQQRVRDQLDTWLQGADSR